MSDLAENGVVDEKPGRIWIPRETWRQEGHVRFVKTVVLQPFQFFAFDRSERRGDSHLWESRRGLAKGTPDTLLVVPGISAWWEWKAGANKPDTDQLRMMMTLGLLGQFAEWGVTIAAACAFYRRLGVPMQPNAEYQALHYDGLVDSRIGKKEAGSPGKAARKPATRKGMTVAQAHRMGMWK